MNYLIAKFGLFAIIMLLVALAVVSYFAVSYLQATFPNNTEYCVYYGISLMVVLAILIFNPFQYFKTKK